MKGKIWVWFPASASLQKSLVNISISLKLILSVYSLAVGE
jgi:hypothetical protein